MKILLLLVSIIIFTSCDPANLEPPINMDGKWIWDALTINDGMFIYEDGVRYTYYWDGVTPVEQLQELFNSYEAGDGNHIPETNNYTFENDGKAYFEIPEYSLVRLSSDCN
jgi:hypothetical protein